MTCRCAPNARCGRCDEPTLADVLVAARDWWRPYEPDNSLARAVLDAWIERKEGRR